MSFIVTRPCLLATRGSSGRDMHSNGVKWNKMSLCGMVRVNHSCTRWHARAGLANPPLCTTAEQHMVGGGNPSFGWCLCYLRSCSNHCKTASTPASLASTAKQTPRLSEGTSDALSAGQAWLLPTRWTCHQHLHSRA